jgi:hypothetical protein
MNNKLPVPDELIMFDRQFSWRTAWKVGHWLYLAFLISTLCDVFFAQEVKQWPFGWRVVIVLAEFLLVALWMRSMARWIRAMDELHRRVTLTIVLFAVSATFFFFLLWLRLDSARFFHTVFGPPFSRNNTWGIYSITHVFILLGGFYGIGYLIFTRRYK